jgi:hypothetical protein
MGIGVGTQLIQGAANAYAAYNAGKVAAAAYKYQAVVTGIQLRDITTRERAAKEDSRRSLGNLLAAHKAKTGSSGVRVGVGSAADWQRDAVYAQIIDETRIAESADRERWSTSLQLRSDQTASKLARITGRNNAMSAVNQSLGNSIGYATNYYLSR